MEHCCKIKKKPPYLGGFYLGWGYTYGPPMAVAPLNQVTRVVDYALTEIPKEKIWMGIPN